MADSANKRIVDVIKVGDRPHGIGLDVSTGDLYTASTDPEVPHITKASPKAASKR